MKTEEIKPGDILFDEERKMLVKVARVDEDGVVKYSAYTDMQRIFWTVPPPYRVGIHTADAYIPATDEQRKYMERNLAVCEYINLPKNNRMETLAYIIADLKAENVMMTERVHQLVDDYNDVVSQLRGMEKHEPNTEGCTLGELTEALDKCEALEKDYKQLAKEHRTLEQMYNELNEKYIAIESIKKDSQKQIDEQKELVNRFMLAEFVEMGQECQYNYKSLKKTKLKVGNNECCVCPHLMRADVFGKKYVLCAYLYDNKKEHDAHERMTTDE